MPIEIQPHIQLSKEIDVAYALLPGDPARVDKVKKYLQEPKELTYNREFKSVVGYYKNTKVLVVSTGIGGPSTAIAVEELANIGVHTLIRIGSTGALQDDIQIGDLLIATAAVRDEGASKSYIDSIYPAVSSHELVAFLKKSAKTTAIRYHCGIIRSHDSFYTDKEEEIDTYWSKIGILGADMETSSLFTIGSLRGLETASILNVVVPSKGSLKDGVNNLVHGEEMASQGEENQIIVALEAIASIHHTKS